MINPREPNNGEESANDPTSEFGREPNTTAAAEESDREPNTEGFREPNTEN